MHLYLLDDAVILLLAISLLWSELCPLQNSYIEALSPGPQNVYSVWRQDLEKMINLTGRRRSSQWALSPYDWCACKKKKFGHTERYQRCMQRGKTVWGHSKEVIVCKPLREVPEETKPCLHLDLGLLASRPVREKFLSVVLCYGRPSKLTQYPEKKWKPASMQTCRWMSIEALFIIAEKWKLQIFIPCWISKQVVVCPSHGIPAIKRWELLIQSPASVNLRNMLKEWSQRWEHMLSDSIYVKC